MDVHNVHVRCCGRDPLITPRGYQRRQIAPSTPLEESDKLDGLKVSVAHRTRSLCSYVSRCPPQLISLFNLTPPPHLRSIGARERHETRPIPTGPGLVNRQTLNCTNHRTDRRKKVMHHVPFATRWPVLAKTHTVFCLHVWVSAPPGMCRDLQLMEPPRQRRAVYAS